MRTPALLLGLSLLACTGADPGGGCRGDEDCGEAESCVPPGAPTGCGIPCPIERGCERDDECDGDVCVEFVASCCFAGELSSACRPSCATAGCGTDERCREDGRCEPTPCDDGFACAPHTRCEPVSSEADAHGCVRDVCAIDVDCEDGTCLFGTCYEGPGTCQGPVP